MVGFPGGSLGTESACNAGDTGRGEFTHQVRKIPLKEGMATHSSILAWKISGEPGGLQSIGSQQVGHDWATEPSCMHTRSLVSSQGQELHLFFLSCSLLTGVSQWVNVHGFIWSNSHTSISFRADSIPVLCGDIWSTRILQSYRHKSICCCCC